MKQPLHVIHVEDSLEDCELIKHLLLHDGVRCEIKRVETRPQLVDLLTNTECDLILSDYTLPEFNGLQALEIASALKPQVPFIFVSGTMGEETAVETLRHGATDYVLKDRLARLGSAVRRALAETEDRMRRHEVERRVHQARRLQAVSTLASGVAHDMNNLLGKIKEQASLLGAEYEHSEPATKIIQTLEGTADKGCELMQRLLAFARKKDAHFARINLLQCLAENVNTLRAILPDNVQLTLQGNEQLPPIFADPEHVERILTNLVINAADAMPNGGQIMISTNVIQFDPILPHFTEVDEMPYVCLKVADSGRGIDEAARPRVFEPFFTTKPPGTGDGLGLPEVFGLMRIHNGLIDIQSEPGKGTVVSLFFPLPRNSSVAVEQITKTPPIQMPEIAAPL